MEQLFQKRIIKNAIEDQDKDLVQERWDKYQFFLAKKKYIQTVKEENYQTGFLQDIFENCLGYKLKANNPDNYSLEREKKNISDSKKADGVIIINNNIVGIIELKDQRTKDLSKKGAREQSTVDQAFGYLSGHNSKYAKYVIVSNFNELRFYIQDKTNYEKFSLFNLTYSEFEKLHLILSFESISTDLPVKLKKKSVTFEQEISDELYIKYSKFRTSLFNNIVINNPYIDKREVLKLTQKLLDRIIFILFGEDRGLLPVNSINKIIKKQEKDWGGNALYHYYKLYFQGINKGLKTDDMDIPAYNGGLFATDDLLDNLIIDDDILREQVNTLSEYDFESDISVNILGHIFEKSISDLEELDAAILNQEYDRKKSKRKKDGVFYTPSYITDYIVEHTLGELCNRKKEELGLLEIETPKNTKRLNKTEKSTLQKMYQYRDYLLQLKILDPACGSGAFLNQALDFLIKEHEFLDTYRRLYENEGLSLYDIEADILDNPKLCNRIL